VLGRRYDGQNCSIARALEIVGERWTMLILRDTAAQPRRFDELQERLGLARNVLAERLQRLCDDGMLERRLYQEHPARYEYAQTEKARELRPVLVGLLRWGDKYYAPHGPPRVVNHRGCGGRITVEARCESCGSAVSSGDMESLPGPGARRAPALPGRSEE
jgi:DNA-binding HxlR family transcriptional regulator